MCLGHNGRPSLGSKNLQKYLNLYLSLPDLEGTPGFLSRYNSYAKSPVWIGSSRIRSERLSGWFPQKRARLCSTGIFGEILQEAWSIRRQIVRSSDNEAEQKVLYQDLHYLLFQHMACALHMPLVVSEFQRKGTSVDTSPVSLPIHFLFNIFCYLCAFIDDDPCIVTMTFVCVPQLKTAKGMVI